MKTLVVFVLLVIGFIGFLYVGLLFPLVLVGMTLAGVLTIFTVMFWIIARDLVEQYWP